MAKPRHRLYDFPPLYTLQVNAQSRQKQLETWAEIILGECAATRQPMVDVATFGLFRNDKIDRTLSPDDAKVVMDFLVKSDRVRETSGGLGLFRLVGKSVAPPLSNVLDIEFVFFWRLVRMIKPHFLLHTCTLYELHRLSGRMGI